MKNSTCIRIQDLKKSYGDFQALKSVNLEVEQGDFVGLIGKNGAGKSTLLNAIASLVRPDSGHISIFGYDVFREASSASSFLGFMPQDFNFNDFMTPMELLTRHIGLFGLSSELDEQTAMHHLKKLQIDDKAHERIGSLSGGMQRRLMLARALITNPKVVILDEPTAGVDVEMKAVIWDYVRTLQDAGVTFILTTHDLGEIFNMCKTIVVIKNGTLDDPKTLSEITKIFEYKVYDLTLENPLHDVSILNALGEAKLLDHHHVELKVKKEVTANQIIKLLAKHDLTIMDMTKQPDDLSRIILDH